MKSLSLVLLVLLVAVVLPVIMPILNIGITAINQVCSVLAGL